MVDQDAVVGFSSFVVYSIFFFSILIVRWVMLVQRVGLILVRWVVDGCVLRRVDSDSCIYERWLLRLLGRMMYSIALHFHIGLNTLHVLLAQPPFTRIVEFRSGCKNVR